MEKINQELSTVNMSLKAVNQTYQSQVRKLRELNDDLENLLGSIDIGVIFLNRQLEIRKYNSSAKNIFNFRASDIGRSIADLKHNLDCANLVEVLEQFLQTGYPNELEVQNLLTKKFLSMRIHCYCLGSGSSEGVILTFVDISDRQKAEQTLKYQAFYDSLTGLPNRLFFLEQLRHAIARLPRQSSQFLAVLYLDLNGFKEVNDSLGHSAGDSLLIEVARRLEKVIRSNDIVSRLGGDEFVILLEEIERPEQSLEVATRIHQILAKTFSIEGRKVTVSTSIGIAFHSAGDKLDGNITTLMENADMAMYRAKQKGVAQTEIFSPKMRSQAELTMEIKTQLRNALEQKELIIYFQPIFALDGDKLRGFEALLRWNHPKLGLIGPEKFLYAIQNSALMFELECWIVERACEQLHQWLQKFQLSQHFSLSVNISPQQLNHPHFLNRLDEILDRVPIARHLTIELTETALIDRSRTTKQILERLRSKGIKIALDDFGTSFSSLATLHSFALDTIKIDRSFVMSLARNKRSSDIIRSIIFLSQQLNLTVVAEGVEKLEQLQWLQEHQCQLGQGHFWSPAIPEAAATKFISSTIENTGFD